MPEMLKKHILSQYASVQLPLPAPKGPTLHTDSTEVSDPDEFHVSGPTYLTHAVESSDPDEFIAAGPTRITFTTEISDEDEFWLM